MPILVKTDGEVIDGHLRLKGAIAERMREVPEGHTTTAISGDTKADWSDAFALVPTLDVAYVWNATSDLVEVAAGLDRIGKTAH